MVTAINPVLPVLSAQEAGDVTPDLALQAGSVVNAQVQKILSADLVRIAIAGLSIDVLSEIPLQAGQMLQLSVSQTPDGVRLQLVGQGTDAANLSDAVTLSPEALVDAAANPAATTSAPKSALTNALTPLERVAVSTAAQSAATVQQSLAPLFANLSTVASLDNLPPQLQQAVAQVLVQQTSLDQSLDGGDIRNAFQKSGLFLEASLASGSIPSSGVPDLKAALIVLRATLQSSLGTTEAPLVPAAPVSAASAGEGATHAAATPNFASGATADFDTQEILLPQARLPVADDVLAASRFGRGPLAAALNAGPSAGATLNLLQEALQELG